ncbi:MAG: hypothetical protein KME23_25220 [Goleter apudmare HA4340-LM2]|jgi:hypothetical protein|nr:hypothetical protein [Goleter apudmare HA4340-LM2]
MSYLVDTEAVSRAEKVGEMTLQQLADIKYLWHVEWRLICLGDYITGNLSSIMSDKSIAKYSLSLGIQKVIS